MQRNSIIREYDDIFQALGEGVLLIIDGVVLQANRSAEELLDWASPLIDRKLHSIIPSDELEKAIAEAESTKERTGVKLVIYKGAIGKEAAASGKGREKQILFQISSIAKGKAVLTITDVTKIEHLATVRQDFVSNVSHELKTPLTAIIGFSETLSEQDLTPDQVHGFARIIHKNSLHMQGIISDLLLLTSLDRSDILPTMENTTDIRILSEVDSYTSFKAEAKRISVIYSSIGVNVTCNESLIVQALINLVVNAISYSPENSIVRVSVDRTPKHIHFIVSDQGCGISIEDQARIFERFYRVDKARSRESGGTGLGLSIVRHIAIIHAGTITVESQEGKGSVFTLSLPIS
ncbi:MAG: ATP-binding protein [Candidatus Ornithospirochaeta sp.]|nr:ATP-binding protein [Candidatus Ornithospirochaeta sp.]